MSNWAAIIAAGSEVRPAITCAPRGQSPSNSSSPLPKSSARDFFEDDMRDAAKRSLSSTLGWLTTRTASSSAALPDRKREAPTRPAQKTPAPNSSRRISTAAIKLSFPIYPPAPEASLLRPSVRSIGDRRPDGCRTGRGPDFVDRRSPQGCAWSRARQSCRHRETIRSRYWRRHSVCYEPRPCRHIRNSLVVSAGDLVQRGQNGGGAPPQTRAAPIGEIGFLTINGVGYFKSFNASIEEACLPIRFRDCLTFSSAMRGPRVFHSVKSYGAAARRSCRLRRAAGAGFRSLGVRDEAPRRAGRPWQRAVPRASFFPAGRQHGQRWHAPVRAFGEIGLGNARGPINIDERAPLGSGQSEARH